ncbi:MAG TPA: aminotransferase class III-fold pyridoxal phosphate-dependent enzyme, partial [Burkholderiaceae bacterium]|nr:aminotransferase class III-fold pyridoxal phosphate-dependent enzyme [Burkholderiaceae bacterium]
MRTEDGARRQQRLLEDAGRLLAGGGTGLFVLPAGLNLVVDHGRGGRIVDVAGREYIDWHLGSGPALLGHAHPGVADAVERRLRLGSTYFFLNEPEIELARRLVDAIPCADCVHYTGSGTEATYYALRIARAFTGRTKILKFEGAWHGMHDYGLFGTVPQSPSPYPHARPDSVGVPAAIGEQVLVVPFNETALALETIERHAAELAAVIVEPLQRVLRPEPGFLEALR